MIILENFNSNFNSQPMVRLSSDQSFYLREIKSGALYDIAEIPETRSLSEFEETDIKIVKPEELLDSLNSPSLM